MRIIGWIFFPGRGLALPKASSSDTTRRFPGKTAVLSLAGHTARRIDRDVTAPRGYARCLRRRVIPTDNNPRPASSSVDGSGMLLMFDISTPPAPDWL